MNCVSINTELNCKFPFCSVKIKKLSDEVSFLVTQLFKCLVKHYFIDNRFSEVSGLVCKVEPERR